MKNIIVTTILMSFLTVTAFAFARNPTPEPMTLTVKTLPASIVPMDIKKQGDMQYVLTPKNLYVGKSVDTVKKVYTFPQGFVPYQLKVNSDNTVSIQGKLKDQQGSLLSDENNHWHFIQNH